MWQPEPVQQAPVVPEGAGTQSQPLITEPDAPLMSEGGSADEDVSDPEIAEPAMEEVPPEEPTTPPPQPVPKWVRCTGPSGSGSFGAGRGGGVVGSSGGASSITGSAVSGLLTSSSALSPSDIKGTSGSVVIG